MNDAFRRTLEIMAATADNKGADYEHDGDPWKTFREHASFFDMSPADVAVFSVVQKILRLKSLRANGRPPVNEAVADTYKDLAVYAALAYAMYLDLEQGFPPEPIDPNEVKVVTQGGYPRLAENVTVSREDLEGPRRNPLADGQYDKTPHL